MCKNELVRNILSRKEAVDTANMQVLPVSALPLERRDLVSGEVVKSKIATTVQPMSSLKRKLPGSACYSDAKKPVVNSLRIQRLLGKLNDTDLDPAEFFLFLLDFQGYDNTTWVAKENLKNLGKYLKVEKSEETKENTNAIETFDLDWKRRLDKNLVEETAEHLSNHGANVTNFGGDTVLHKACRKGASQIVALLLAHGADLNICDESGRTPLHDACWTCEFHESVLSMILRISPDLMLATDRFGALPLNYIGKDLWSACKQFLFDVRERYWPRQGDLSSVSSHCTDTYSLMSDSDFTSDYSMNP